MSRLNTFISRIDFSAIAGYIKEHGTPARYAKGEPLVEIGTRCRYVGIIRSGYFKFSAINSKGNEVVAGFLFQGDVIMDFVRGFLRDEPSLTSIIAGSDAEIIRVPMGSLRHFIMEQCTDFVADASSLVLHEAYCRYLDVLIKTPTERYRELMARCPNEIRSLPIQELVSYLSVSRRQLHRIREEH